ncbi:hypothetical protein EXIGLDRAFT_293308 [Exidia glandulosa HHB12029]|uniref:Uncharacterized protein n=1 Tax=Exidia glandulosa HHB12029 TaxID=1314781 RepID=A0A165M2C9_EXIGL|nr:hypothetical protein EXIGLDRAFT_293308 [Exidia glandulosa HHB12029]
MARVMQHTFHLRRECTILYFQVLSNLLHVTVSHTGTLTGNSIIADVFVNDIIAAFALIDDFDPDDASFTVTSKTPLSLRIEFMNAILRSERSAGNAATVWQNLRDLGAGYRRILALGTLLAAQMTRIAQHDGVADVSHLIQGLLAGDVVVQLLRWVHLQGADAPHFNNRDSDVHHPYVRQCVHFAQHCRELSRSRWTEILSSLRCWNVASGSDRDDGHSYDEEALTAFARDIDDEASRLGPCEGCTAGISHALDV